MLLHVLKVATLKCCQRQKISVLKQSKGVYISWKDRRITELSHKTRKHIRHFSFGEKRENAAQRRERERDRNETDREREKTSKDKS